MRSNKAFSAVEILFVVCVICLLAVALLLPAVNTARKVAREQHEKEALQASQEGINTALSAFELNQLPPNPKNIQILKQDSSYKWVYCESIIGNIKYKFIVKATTAPCSPSLSKITVLPDYQYVLDDEKPKPVNWLEIVPAQKIKQNWNQE